MIESLTLIPYVKTPEGWTLPDDTILTIWALMEAEATARRVFCTGAPNDGPTFLQYLQEPTHHVLTIWAGGNIAWISWLTGIKDTFACIHAAGFRGVWGTRSKECQRLALKYWFSFRNDAGEPMFETLIAIIPETNRLAINLGKKIGLHFVGTIPGLIKNHYTGERVGSSLLYARREDFSDG